MKEKKLKFSKFLKKFKKNDIVALYHSLKIKTLYLEESIANKFSIFEKFVLPRKFINSIPIEFEENGIKLIYEAQKIGILISDQKEDEGILKYYQNYYLERPSIGIMYLILTSKCNLNCSYCFLKPSLSNLSPTKSSEMSLDTALKSLNAYKRNLSNNSTRKTIILYGGEPLLNFKAIKFVVEKIDDMKNRNELPHDIAITINTNATRITTEICSLFKKYDIAVSVSLDGPKYIHNKNRIKFDGSGSYVDTIEGFFRLKSAGVQTGISCTVTNEISKILPEITSWFIKDLKADFLGFNPLTYTTQDDAKDEDYAHNYTSSLIKSYKIAREFGCYEDRMMRKIESFVKGEIYPFDCAGCGRQLVVAPDGQVGVCHAFLNSRNFFCNTKLDSLNVKHEEYWLEWCRRSPLGMKECFDCVALGICGGGCPYNSYLAKGSIWDLDHQFCTFSKNVLEWMIWDAWENK